MTTAHHVQLISAEATIPLRSRILRPLHPLESCKFDGDRDATSFHLGLFLGNQIVSIGSFVYQSHPLLHGGSPYRLRGMATHENFRGRGFAAELLNHGVALLKDRRCDLLWFNAREKAVQFYLKAGFQIEGGLFDMPGVGPHKIMYKHLILR